MTIEEKKGRVFVDLVDRPWILRAVNETTVFVEGPDEFKAVSRPVFEKCYHEMAEGDRK